MKYLSICSGIEAASVAWEQLGWEAVGFSEIEPFPCAVLRHRFPDVPLHGDFTALIESPPSCDVLVGGTPCQAFSVAGSRRSLDDARGNLTLAYVMLADAIDRRNREEGKEPCITVWENVPGVFSTKDNAFGAFLGGLSGEDGPLEPPGGKWTHCGAVLGPQRAIAWRVQDAQYHGLAQRRQRVFVVASARNGFDPSQVLLEWEGVRRDSAPSREARKDATAALGGGVEKRRGKHGRDDGRGRGNGRVEVPCPDPAGPLGGASQSGGFRTTDLDNNGSYIVHDVVGAITARYGGQAMGAPTCASTMAFDSYNGTVGDASPTLCTSGDHATGNAGAAYLVRDESADDPPAYCYPDADQLGYAPGDEARDETKDEAVDDMAPASTPVQAPFVFDTTQVTHPANFSSPKPGDPSHPLAAAGHAPTLAASAGGRMVVRRLTPRECERLQGFPDDWTLIPWKGKPAVDCPDGPRYKALGNSMAVPVMRWIGRRIAAYVAAQENT